ncbi:MAG: hypothetical protein H0X27_06865, partial [Caulobacteraceae bacterium]|nr:hypothetical protein [Caulobacteraceae bacterium]
GVDFDRPLLPAGVDRLTVAGLAIGENRFDCEITRGPSGGITAKSLKA